MKKCCIIITLLALLFAFYKTIQAATIFQQVGISTSPNPVGSGARALGMGGAFIAIADDATAASWNPAALIQLERPEVSFVGAYFSKRDEFSSDIHTEIGNTGKADDININYFSVSYPFRLQKNMVFSINYQRLYEFDRSFHYLYDYSSMGADLLQHKHFRQKGYIGALGLASAIQITPTLSLGATLNIWTDKLFWENGWHETFDEKGVGTQGGNPVTINTSYSDKYSNFRGINGNLGLLWNMNTYLTLGVVIKTPFDASLYHEYTFKQTSIFGPPVSTTLSDQDSLQEDVELRMPLSYGIGLAWRVSDALSFDFDIYRTKWSDYILIDSEGNRFSPIDGRPDYDSDVEDTTQIRFGGEYIFIRPQKNIDIPVRAGIFYDPEPSHKELRHFYGLSIGFGIAYKTFIFDMAYQARWSQDVDTGNMIATSKADIMQHLLLTSIIIHF